MDFASKRGWFYLVSLLVILPGAAFLIISPGLKPGIDFTGGSTLTLEFTADVSQTDLRERMAAEGHPDATIQRLGDRTYFIRVKELADDSKANLVDALEAGLSPDGVSELSFDLVSPIVASETVRNAMYAVLAAAAGIFIYVWWAFRNVPSPFRYGAAAIIALLHDTIIVIGAFSALGYLLGIEVGTMFLIALLTVIGYSVNDTIVVFDRIRENVATHPNRELREVVNLSISETIGRSLNTSLTLLITISALLLFGGATIREFLLTLLIGVIAGTYSSIAVASQALISWEYGDIPRLLGRRRRGGAGGCGVSILVRIQDSRDYRIFRILPARVFDGRNSPLWRKARAGRIEILKIPPILKILILTKTRGRPRRPLANSQPAKATRLSARTLPPRSAA